MGTPVIDPLTIVDIGEERVYQIEKGFTQTADDDLMPHEWVDLLQVRIEHIENAISPGTFREQMVKVAALAVAAIEAHDRAVH